MSEHTPTPLTVDGIMVIALTWNAHDALVAACEAARAYLVRLDYGIDPTCPCEGCVVLLQLNLALAKPEGE